MLNFVIVGGPVAFAVFGFIVGKIRRRVHSYIRGDTRLLTAPFLTILCTLLLTHDSSNVVAVTLFYWAVPALIVFITSDRLTKESIYEIPETSCS
jgi:hypothetical protein